MFIANAVNGGMRGIEGKGLDGWNVQIVLRKREPQGVTRGGGISEEALAPSSPGS